MTLDEFISFSTEPVSMQQSVNSSSEQEESKEEVRMMSISPKKGQAKQQKENVVSPLMQLSGDY